MLDNYFVIAAPLTKELETNTFDVNADSVDLGEVNWRDEEIRCSDGHFVEIEETLEDFGLSSDSGLRIIGYSQTW